jgi:arabinose-5-phosphate isomerase
LSEFKDSTSNSSPKGSNKEILGIVRSIKDHDAQAILDIPEDNPYMEFAEAIWKCKLDGGKVIMTGVGTSGMVSKRAAITLASIGIPSFFINATDAQYGEVGVIGKNDVFISFDNTGTNIVLENLLDVVRVRRPNVKILLVTGDLSGIAAQNADIVLCTGNPVEVCTIGLTPTTSTTVMGCILNIVTVLLQRMSNFNLEDFSQLHFFGYLGVKLKQNQAMAFKLNEREIHILNRMGEGYSRKDIANSHNLSTDGIGFHIKNIYTKLDVHTSTEAVRKAINIGVISSTDGGKNRRAADVAPDIPEVCVGCEIKNEPQCLLSPDALPYPASIDHAKLSDHPCPIRSAYPKVVKAIKNSLATVKPAKGTH